MGKETKEMLKTLLANTELIMKHLNIEAPAKEHKKEIKEVAKKPTAKKLPAKKAAAGKK